MTRSSLQRQQPGNGDAREPTVHPALQDIVMEQSDVEFVAEVRAELGEDFDDYMLINEYLAGALSPEDAERVKERLDTDAKFRALAEPLIEMWNLPLGISHKPNLPNPRETERAWDKLKERIELEEQGIHTPTLEERLAAGRRRGRALLTAILFAITGLVTMWRHPSWVPAPSLYMHVDASVYKARVAELPDEIQVTLAPGSRLSYLRWFRSSNTDTVTLDGEGTFSLPPGPRKALVVAGPGVTVKASEGRFTIQAFDAVPYAYVKVHEGRAEVRARTVFGYGQVLTLRAGEGARVGPGLWIDRADPPITAHR